MHIRLGKSLGLGALRPLGGCGALACGAAVLAGCLGAGDDNSSALIVSTDGGDAHASDASHATDGTASEGGHAADASLQDGGDGATAPPPVASLSAGSIDFGAVGCGAMPTTMPLGINNSGGSPLHVSASEVGAGFTISPTTLVVAPGKSDSINVTVNVPLTATAGTPITGSLAVFTDDPTNSNVAVLLSATPTGGTLAGAALYGFASSEIGTPAPPLALQLTNSGNAVLKFTIGAPSNPTVTMSALPLGGAVTLNPGAPLSSGIATFLPTNASAVSATSAITPMSPTCGPSLTSLTFNGQGTAGVLAGWPSGNTVDFGLVSCGAAPAPQKITLKNTSLTTDVHITAVNAAGIANFTTDAAVGESIPAGGTLDINFTAPTVPPVQPSLTVITGIVVIHTDADSGAAGTSLTLTEEPQGAVLAFGTSTTAGCTTSASFGSFGAAGLLLQTGPSQNFCVVNTGNAAAQVTLVAGEQGSSDGGVNDASADATVADANADSGVISPFSVLVPSFSLPASTSSSTPSVQQESITFQPQQQGATVGSLAITTNAVLCALLPSAVSLSGSAVGGGPVVTPTALSFPATCGGVAPASQSFAVQNNSTSVNMSWTLSGPVGTGMGQYTVTADPAPGLLEPGASSVVTVTAAAIPSPAVDPSPASLAAQVIVMTDVPLDAPHVVTLSEEPLGDQLFVSTGDQAGNLLRFGQVPVSTPLTRNITVTNNANPNSPAASISVVVGGAGAAAYTPASQTAAPAAGTSVAVPLTFNAPAATSYPGTLTFTTSDALCTPLPANLVLEGTGTAGAASLSASTLYFGTNPRATDPTLRGLVDCGATGTTQTLTISNVGSLAFNVLTATLAGGSTSPFTLSGPAATMVNVPIGGSTAVTITPSAIPNAVANPNDPNAFSDTLSITTDIPGDTGHTVALVMQPLGAIISGAPPPSAWPFGTVGEGSIGTFQGTTIVNTGNASATVTLQAATPFSLPSVFGLQGNPVTVPANGVTSLVGQFAPNQANGSWSGQGELVVTAGAFCAPLPAAWVSPQITLSGTSSSSPPVTIAGSLVFPTSDCGGAPAGGQSVTLTNSTNQAYTYTLKFFSGAHYTRTDGGSGTLPANGVSTIVVNPVAVTPGPGVLPGSAPYADDLIVTLDTSPVTTFTVPISWTLDGAVLSLVQGAGPYGAPGSNFYAADSTSGFPLGISNTGTAAATVNFAIQPSGAFSVIPAPPVQVLPGIPASPELVSGASAPTCPTTSSGMATFAYSGPVCQPLPFASVDVESCSGTYVPTVVPPPSGDAGADASGGDAATIEAGGDASAASSPVPCTGGTYPSNTPAGCVPCLGNRQTGAEAGECTPTEQLVMSYDIVKNGMTPTSDTVAATSCYYCLLAGTCLDSAAANSVVGIGIAHVVTHNKSNLECEDPQTADNVAATNPGDCRDALQCTLTGGGTLSAGTLTGGTGECTSATPPASTDPNASVGNCYCGTATGANCLAAGKANGACVTNITTDVGSFLSSNNPTSISGALTDGSQSPGGVGDQILNCGLTADCDVCFK